jgi:hypothetical protein
MGLDIFVHKVKKSVAEKYSLTMSSSYSDIHDALTIENKEEYMRKATQLLNEYSVHYDNHDSSDYKDIYISFIKKLQKEIPLYNKYENMLIRFGYNAYTDELLSCKTPNEVREIFGKEYLRVLAVEDCYFRKVNFIYEFFSKDMVDECCVVDKKDIGILVKLCSDVIKRRGDEDYAREVLPTTSGFFFGSTEYDEGYWCDVEDCLIQMTELYNSMDDDDFVLWVFSW